MIKPTIMERARADLVLDHPFFASITLRHPMTETRNIPTAQITDRGHISYNPDFIENLSVKQAVFVLCHEVMHYACMHGIRRKHRDPFIWNIAGDMYINDVLKQCGVGEFLQGCIDAPGSSKKSVEDLYQDLMQQVQEQCGKGSGKGKEGGKGKGLPGQGDPLRDDLDKNSGNGPSQSEIDEIEAQTKIEVAEAGHSAKMRGKLPGVLADFVSMTVESRIPWYDILERFMTDRVKQDLSWTRPNRRFMAAEDQSARWYLPTLDGVGAMGEIVVQVDISGSVSKKEIEHYNGHLKRIVEQTRPHKVHVIYTDTEVQKHEEFDTPEDMEIRFYSGGGTDMRAGIDWVEDKGYEPEVFICLTDGYTPFPEHAPFPTVWCISSDAKSPIGENVHFKIEEE